MKPPKVVYMTLFKRQPQSHSDLDFLMVEHQFSSKKNFLLFLAKRGSPSRCTEMEDLSWDLDQELLHRYIDPFARSYHEFRYTYDIYVCVYTCDIIHIHDTSDKVSHHFM